MRLIAFPDIRETVYLLNEAMLAGSCSHKNAAAFIGRLLRSMLEYRLLLLDCENESHICRSLKGDLLETDHELIDLVIGVERARADANRAIGEGAELLVDVWRAMQARTNRNVERFVQNGADLAR